MPSKRTQPDAPACRVMAETARRFAAALLQAQGVPPGDARTAARVLVRSDLRGISTHGLRFLPVYLRRLQGGGANPRPDIRQVESEPWGAVLDGDAALGQVGATAAAQEAARAAAEGGLGFAVCRNTSHVGALAPYLLELLPRRVALAFTNTGASMAPPGGNLPAVGNNCLGFAAPVAGAPPVCLDMTTSTMAWGKVRQRILSGEALPEGVALLEDGTWARDPAAALARAVAAPLGGGKGFGLALLVDVLAAGLSGGTFSPGLELLHREFAKPEGACVAFLVFDLSRMASARGLARRLAVWRSSIKKGRRMQGVEEVFLPGEQSARREGENRAKGFPLAPDLRDELNRMAAESGLRRRL